MMSSQWLTLIGGGVCYGLFAALSVWLQTHKHIWVSHSTEMCVNILTCCGWVFLSTSFSLWYVYVHVGSETAVCEEDFRELRDEAEGVRL